MSMIFSLQFAGFIFHTSIEVSSFSVFILSIHCYILVKYPYTKHNLARTSSLVSCISIWGTSITTAAFSQTPTTSVLRTAACIALPISEHQDHIYSFSVMIMLKLTVYIMVSLIGIAISVTLNKLPIELMLDKDMFKRVQYVRQYSLIIVANCMSWLGISLIGVGVKSGMVVSQTLNLGIIIFAIPFNAVINPILYQYSLSINEKREAKIRNVYRHIQAKMKHRLASNTGMVNH